MSEDNTEDTAVRFVVVIGAVLVAILCGVIWGCQAILTGYELGFLAWAVGGLCGVGVVFFSKGEKAISFQVISVCSSIIGITIGKYIIFYDSVAKLFKEEYGAEAANDVSIFSIDLMRVFIENIGTTLGGLDIVWVILALITAWTIPKGMRFKKRSS